MGKSGTYVGLDIGTTSIKVIVAEYIKGQMNVIGVGSERSEGLSRGIIVDIDKAVSSIKKAVAQAEEKANVSIKEVIAGIPANMLQIVACQGMVAVGDQAREITDEDVNKVTNTALVRNLPPEREVIALEPNEFIVDGFDGIKDPRGMIGVRLELKGILFTAPKTVIHNIRKVIEKAGLVIQDLVVNPLALGQLALSDGEQDFGTVLLDLGGGQSTASVIHDHKLKYTDVDQEGGEYVTKDISMVLNTSFSNAEKIKRDYGVASPDDVTEDNAFPVEVVGKTEPADITEDYLAQIIEARMVQIFERFDKALKSVNALDLPGGIVITGGTAALPGVANLAANIFGRPVKLYVPDQMGLRHPAFAQGLSLVYYEAHLTEIDRLVLNSINQKVNLSPIQTTKKVEMDYESDTPKQKSNQNSKNSNRLDGLKNFLSNFFE